MGWLMVFFDEVWKMVDLNGMRNIGEYCRWDVYKWEY